MSTTTPTPAGAPIPAPPAGWFTSEDRALLRQRVPGAQTPPYALSPDLTPALDPDEARRVCEQIQAGSRRAARDGHQYAPRTNRDRRVVKMLDAANCLAAASAEGPDDEIGQWAAGLVHDIREFAGRYVTVPATSDIRPEVPQTGAAA